MSRRKDNPSRWRVWPKEKKTRKPADKRDTEELVSDTSLLLRDGSILPAVDLIFGFTGGGSHNTEDEYLSSADFTSQFQDLLDVSQVAAVQVGDIQIPLE